MMASELVREIQLAGEECADAEASARAYANRRGLAFVSPYNDPLVIAGQGTIAVECCEQLQCIDALVASVGGGGLISGAGAYLKARHPAAQVIGCAPERSNAMFQSLDAGRIVDVPTLPTLSDGTAGGLERGTVTFDLCRALIDHHVVVTEEEILCGANVSTRTLAQALGDGS